MCRHAKIEYEKEVHQNVELHDVIAAEKAKEKYTKRYDICKDVSS